MTVRLATALVALEVLCAVPAAAESAGAEAKRMLVVLPLDARHTKGRLDPDAQVSMEEMLRDVATNELGPSGWVVLTGETTLRLLRDNGVDVSKCDDDGCHLDTARNINVGSFISGSVQFADGRFTASVRLIETATGRIRVSVPLEGDSVKELRDNFLAQAPTFFQRSGLTNPSSVEPPAAHATEPQIRTSQVTSATGSLLVFVKPQEGTRLTLQDPDGVEIASGAPYRNAAAKPGHWRVKATSDGYEPTVREFDVPPDEPTEIKFNLKMLGGLNITGKPEGAALIITGPAGFRSGGGLPLWEGLNLRSGIYQVQAERPGYLPMKREAAVDPGETAHIEMNLQRMTTEEEAAREAAAAGRAVHIGVGASLLALMAGGVAMAATSYPMAESAHSSLLAQTLPVNQAQRSSLLSQGNTGNGLGVAGVILAPAALVAGISVLATGHYE